MPDGAVRVDALAQLRQRRQRALRQPVGRRAARRPFRRPCRRRLFEVSTTSTSAAMCCRSRCANRRWPVPTRRSARLPTSRASCPTPPGAAATSPAASLTSTARLNIGVSVSHHTLQYGVPIRFSLDPGDRGGSADHRRRARPAPTLRANVPLGGFFKLFEFRGGISQIPSRRDRGRRRDRTRAFSPRAAKLRADLVQPDRGGWGGTSGVQYLDTTTRASAARRNTCPTASNQQTRPVHPADRWSKGRCGSKPALRVEFARLHADEDAQIAANGGIDRHHAHSRATSRRSRARSAPITNSAAGWRAGLSLSHSERAPSIDELFANGPHGGSQSFEVGDPGLELEKQQRASSSASTARPARSMSRAASTTAASPTSSSRRRPARSRTICRSSSTARARPIITGSSSAPTPSSARRSGIDWGGELVTDAVRATIKGFGPAPQIPPFRVLARADRVARPGRRPDRGRAGRRPRTAPRRSKRRRPATRWSMPRSTGTRSPPIPTLTLSLQGNNLFDVDARRHSSLLKDYAPLAGRDIRLIGAARLLRRKRKSGPASGTGPLRRASGGGALARAFLRYRFRRRSLRACGRVP